jgi:beta-fructofuranosidase
MNKATQYIEKNIQNVNTVYKPSYHLTAPVGWINDPNGFIYFDGEYHLFYQHYPYATEWGPMHWGHAKTKDLVNWEHLPVALEPTENYEADGCFSGSAVVKDDRLYLMYTGHYERNGVKQETQCIAYSDDGINFEKYAHNPVISSEHISGIADEADFRDPKVFEKDGIFYCVVASKTIDNRGQILLFESIDLFDWQFKSVLLEGDEKQGIMWECPDLFELGNKDVLIISPIQMPSQGNQYQNVSSAVAFIGTVDWKSGKFKVENYHEIDSGLDFYAPQTCETESKERLLVAWMQMWGRTMPPHDLNHGWVNAMTIPRKIELRQGRVVQLPVAIDKKFRKKVLDVKKIQISEASDMEISISKNSIVSFEIEKGESAIASVKIGTRAEHILVAYNFEKEELSIDRSNSGYKIIGDEEPIIERRVVKSEQIDKKIQVTMYIDTCSIELFTNTGIAMTTTFYRKEKDVSLFFESDSSLSIKNLSADQLVFLEENV